jgi:hypothetical protein
MSRGGRNFSGTDDFARSNVISAVRVLMAHSSPEIAERAVEVVGCHNPYMSDGNQEYWLNAISPIQIPGMAAMNTNLTNVGAQMCISQLVAIVESTDNHAAVGTRALAIRALGRSQPPPPAEAVFRWCAFPEPELRASAAVLLSDFPGPDANAQLEKLAADGAAKVREATAIAIGYSRQVDLLSLLGKLLSDDDASVRRAASSSLQSFPATNEIVAGVMKANLDKPDFGPLFLNTLARANAAPYLDALAKAVQEQTTPSNWHGGKITAYDAWEILFAHLKKQPAEDVRSGKFDRYLDALEREVGQVSSSIPRDIYAFYLQRGLTTRAKQFRESAKKSLSYDIDYFFDMVDKNPSLYTQ